MIFLNIFIEESKLAKNMIKRIYFILIFWNLHVWKNKNFSVKGKKISISVFEKSIS